jgi:tetrahydromethanopterin S-methyltransferase subunit G
MSNQDHPDISNIQVPQSLIQEILSQTQPLEESRKKVHPSQPQEETKISEQGEVVKLLSLVFEEFDKLNARLDKIQESVNEVTGAAMGSPTTVGKIGVGTGLGGKKDLKSLLRQRMSR